MAEIGKVYIIGAGPGDPGLITLKAIECLREADVVVYDFLVNEELLKYAQEGARFIYAGKKGGDHSLSQDKISALLVHEALAGNVVARLKGGDPFIFGRGGEEAELLAINDVPFEIIPGVTSAIAVPAYAGIPLTHRGLTSTVAFVTGHEDPTKDKSDIDWQALAGIGTLVFLMGVKNLSQIAEALIAHGKAPETPAALIRWGTMPQQEILTEKLSDIAACALVRGFSPPAILVVGKVVELRESLSWFEQKPLFGKGIVITRPEKQADELTALLEKEGAQAINFPTIKVIPPAIWIDLDAALNNLSDYNWLIFTSANGVKYFFERLFVQDKDIRELKGIKICCIGPSTALQVKKMGIKIDLIPEYYVSESILQSFAKMNMQGQKVLIPRTADARDILPEGLKKMGAIVDVVTAYVTVNSGEKREKLAQLISDKRIDVITFTSSSTITRFLEIMGKDYAIPPPIKIACIGPITAAMARKAGWKVDIQQEEYTMQGLVHSLIDYFGQKASAEKYSGNDGK
jgi:uroporphyrinogen III methyltransferase / synthase